MESPQDFLIGIGIGTSSLVSGVVSGALTSTASIVNTATRGISYLSADPEYVKARASKRMASHASKGGLLEGLVDGSESVISGISSGVSGLFKKPIEEGAKGGVLGFMVGVGKGVVGVAVKPVLGVADGLTSVAQGISNQVSNVVAIGRMRPMRALERYTEDFNQLVVTPLDVSCAEAQDFIMSQPQAEDSSGEQFIRIIVRHGLIIKDAYVTFVPLNDQALILSERCFYWRQAQGSIFKIEWTQVSHFVLEAEKGIILYQYNQKSVFQQTPTILIPCPNRASAKNAYTQLYKCSVLVGNPVSFLPADVAERTASEISEYMKRYCCGLNLAGDLEGYHFGSANALSIRCMVDSETEIISRAVRRFAESSSWREVDMKLWLMVAEWDGSHVGLAASHCTAALLINMSDTTSQLTSIQILSGADFKVIPGSNYYSESRALLPGGFVVIFAWGYSPTPVESGAVHIDISTDYYTITLSNTSLKTRANSFGGQKVSFLEKSSSQWWSKYVMHVS